MPRWLKLVLGLIGALLALCLVTAAAGFAWLDRNKDRLKGVGERATTEGQDFGDGRDAEACLDEALQRLAARNGIVDQAEHKLFLKACLATAARDAGFCRDVPAKGELSAQSVITSAGWAMGRCTARGKPQDQDCARLMQVVQEACQRR
jgi:hypothetical protein